MFAAADEDQGSWPNGVEDRRVREGRGGSTHCGSGGRGVLALAKPWCEAFKRVGWFP